MAVEEIIEGEAREVALVPVAADHGMTVSGPLALAGLSDDEFDRRLSALETMRNRVARMQKALMVKDVDYGVIPGTGTKPTLLKPGAEKLCQAYGLAAAFTPTRIVGDGSTEPHLSYVVRCQLHLGSTDGAVVAEGNASANSWERKHRYRKAERTCPNCGQAAIIKGKAEYGGGWVCFKKKGGCGSKWADGAKEIEGQTVADVENPDPFDLDVVLIKMAEKRAFIDATLRATAASGLFTQDIEDLPHNEPPPPSDEYFDTRPPSDLGRPELERRVEGMEGKVQIGRGKKSKEPITHLDLELRGTPEGSLYGFKLVAGKTGFQVHAKDALAEALAIAGLTEGEVVKVWGSVESVPFTTDEGFTTSYKDITLERIETAEWRLPA